MRCLQTETPVSQTPILHNNKINNLCRHPTQGTSCETWFSISTRLILTADDNCSFDSCCKFLTNPSSSHWTIAGCSQHELHGSENSTTIYNGHGTMNVNRVMFKIIKNNIKPDILCALLPFYMFLQIQGCCPVTANELHSVWIICLLLPVIGLQKSGPVLCIVLLCKARHRYQDPPYM